MAHHPEPPPPDEDDVVDLAASDLGPFCPPEGYRFEEELQGPAPRPIPRSVRRARHGRHRFRVSWGALFAGALVTAGGLAPGALPSGVDLLPLVLLRFVGVLFLAIGVGGVVWRVVARGPYRYVIEGVPLVARIVALGRRTLVVHDGRWRSDVYEATLRYRDPRTGELRETVDLSRTFAAGPGASIPPVSYRVGDYATAVTLPDDPDARPRLYGFLDLRDALGLTFHSPLADPGPVASLLILTALTLALDAIFWVTYAFFRYAPLAVGAGSVAMLIVPGMLTGGLVFVAWRAFGPEADEPDSRLGRGTLLLFGFVAVAWGGAIPLGAAFAANVLLDRAPAREEAVVIDRAEVSRHRFGLRTYTITYRFVRGDPSSHRFEETGVGHDRFADPPMPATAIVRPGRFGWPWVEDIRPAAPGGEG